VQNNPKKNAQFFKTGADQYAAHDQFLGITVPTLRAIAKQYAALPLTEIAHLLASPFNEERFLGLVLLTNRYKKGDASEKGAIYQFYMAHRAQVNNWNLVDCSAHLILGAHVMHGDKEILISLAQSPIMWERRIAMVATWHFGKYHQEAWTIKLAELLLHDQHDLIHKAVGWMLREMGKHNLALLTTFLDTHAPHMPRTMLRYAIEKLPDTERKEYLSRKSA
jgi:3-methyladenine DNA glycosylase AlkD